ncbi:MAG: hypothetical protein ACFFAN_06190 [Promethearchaeota archaeon]
MTKKTENKNFYDKENKKGKKLTIHTTISRNANKILEKYINFKDSNNKIIFGSKSKVIEKALELLDNHYYPVKADLIKVWCRARAELNMLLVGKTTFLSYIKGKKEEAYSKNVAIEVIEWYLGKRKDEMDLEDFLNGLKGMWHVANYFYNIELEKNEKGAFQMKFKHDLTENYSSFWAEYFKMLLENQWNCSVEAFVRNESFYLIIKET